MTCSRTPWPDAVVWSDRTVDGARLYEWLGREHIRAVTWTQGHVSILIAHTSFLAKHLVCMIIRAPFITVGRNVPVG